MDAFRGIVLGTKISLLFGTMNAVDVGRECHVIYCYMQIKFRDLQSSTQWEEL